MRLPTDTRTAGGDPTPAQPIRRTALADGAGNCTITLDPVPFGQRWLVSYVTVTTSGALQPTVDLFIDGDLFDGTNDGSSAIAPYNPQRALTQDQVLSAVWAGAPAGATCTLRVEYDVEVA